MRFDESKHLLNYESIDDLHVEFVDIYNSIKKDSLDSYENVMIELLEHTKQHFCHEEELMERFLYPRKKEHIDEHQKVIAEMEYFLKKSNSKIGKSFLRSYVNEKLPYWFGSHLLTMDSDLTSFLKSK